MARLLLAACAVPGLLHAQHPAIQQLVDAVSADSLMWRMERLSGEVAVDVGAGDAWILSRHQSQPGNALAAAWLQQEFSRMGYAPTAQTFGSSGANILVEKPGLLYPERKVVICAHYDDMPGGPIAPGADDDGSGVCAVLEAARVMAGHAFENTIVFALWDQEEQGLIGSAYYANVAGGNDVQVTAVVNMDAIGYDGDGDGLLRIHARAVANSIALKDSMLLVNTLYGLDLPIAVNDPGETYSDHASFWSEGYGAILLIEDFDNDPNPHYHTPNDRLQYLDTAYWRNLTRLAVGTTAAMAVPMAEVGVEEVGSEPRLVVFPNPNRGTAAIRITGGTGPQRLYLTDATGRLVRQWAPVLSSAGTARLTMDGLSAGSYLLHVHAGMHRAAQRIIVLP